MDDGIKIVIFGNRPVQVFRHVRYTVLDGILKIGGLLGIMRLVTFATFCIHTRMFKKEL
jgi:hypothetical protein